MPNVYIPSGVTIGFDLKIASFITLLMCPVMKLSFKPQPIPVFCVDRRVTYAVRHLP